MRRRLGLVAALVLLLLPAAAPQPRETLTFVVSPRSEVRDLSYAELRRLFLGQTSRWRDRHRVVVFLRSPASPEGRILLDRVVRMSDIDYSQHWIGAIFRGEAAAVPRIFESRQALLRAVAENPDAIGYVLTSDQPVGPARAITIDGKTPQDPEYRVAR
jgi:ABC-type phosphate transport system substrate-binding protein